jgi:hypothetical protein
MPWSHFPTECLLYLAFMSVPHLAAFLVGYLIAALLLHRQPGAFRQRVGRLRLFMGLLLLVSSAFNGLWSCLIWGRLYESMNYLIDFLPIWPITRTVIDVPWGNERGRLIEVSLFQLQLIWLLFAAGTWGCTVFIYRFVRRQGRLTRGDGAMSSLARPSSLPSGPHHTFETTPGGASRCGSPVLFMIGSASLH